MTTEPTYYEVNELQDLDDKKGILEPQFTIHTKQQSTGSGRLPVLVIIGLLLLILLLVGAVLGLGAATLLQTQSSDQSSTAGLQTSGGNCPACNCSTVDSSYANQVALNNTLLQQQVSQLSMAVQSQVGQLNITLQNQAGYLISTSAKVNETAWKVDDIQRATSRQLDYAYNNSDTLNQVLQTTQESAQNLTNIVATLSGLKDTSITSAAVIDDILLVVDKLLELQNGSSLFNSLTPVSCQDIKRVLPNSPTGYYHVNARNIYCNMDELCGSGGGWTRLAHLDMSDATVNCPSTLNYYTGAGIRGCKRACCSPSCQSVKYPSYGINYSEVCGRVTGYQFGHTDAMSPGNQGHPLDSYYIDGVSITRGSPRKHVWSFVAGLYQNQNSPTDTCPCYPGSTVSIPAFIGNDYFCESGNPNNYYIPIQFYSNDPLWDGQGCSSLETNCCSSHPWFHKALNTNTTDYIELRICGDEGAGWDDVLVTYYDIYVK